MFCKCKNLSLQSHRSQFGSIWKEVKGTNGGELNEQSSCDGFRVLNAWVKWKPAAQEPLSLRLSSWSRATLSSLFTLFSHHVRFYQIEENILVLPGYLLPENASKFAAYWGGCECTQCHISSKPFIKEHDGGQALGRCGAIRFKRSCTQPPPFLPKTTRPHPHPIWTGMNKNHWSIWNFKQTSWVGNSQRMTHALTLKDLTDALCLCVSEGSHAAFQLGCSLQLMGCA